MKNDVKLQVLISTELLKKLVDKILKTSLKNNNKKIDGISAYVRNLIIKDVSTEISLKNLLMEKSNDKLE